LRDLKLRLCIGVPAKYPVAPLHCASGLHAIDHPEWYGKGDGIGPATRYPDFVTIARGFGWEAELVADKSELPAAIKRMIDSPGSFLLDITVPYQEHVLPMIPAGATLQDMIRR